MTIGLLIPLLCGCVREFIVDDATVFKFQLWVPMTAMLACVALAIVGWFLRTVIARIGWGLLIVSPLMMLIAVPGLVFDRVTVKPQGFQLRTGFWFAPTLRDVTFSELTEIRVISKTRLTKAGRRTDYSLHCMKRSGDRTDVPVGDLMKRALEKVLQTAREANVPVKDQR